MLNNKFMIFWDDEGGGAAAPETPATPSEPQEPADSGRDVDELKESIGALKTQLAELTAELKRKDPDAQTVKPDFEAYFSQYKHR